MRVWFRAFMLQNSPWIVCINFCQYVQESASVSASAMQMRSCMTSMSTSTHDVCATNGNANCVIGIRSNNLLKSCCELRILFGNYVYSSAHPVDVVAAATSDVDDLSLSLCVCVCNASFISPKFSSLFNFSKTHILHPPLLLRVLFGIIPSHFLLLHFVCRASLFSFDLISYFIFTSLLIQISLWVYVLCEYVLEKFSSRWLWSIEMKYANVSLFVHRHNVLHMCFSNSIICFLLFVVEVDALSLSLLRKLSGIWWKWQKQQ